MVGNTLYLIAIGYYIVVTFFGYHGERSLVSLTDPERAVHDDHNDDDDDDEELTVADDERFSLTVLASHGASTRPHWDLGRLVDRQSLRLQFTEAHRTDHAEGCLFYAMRKKRWCIKDIIGDGAFLCTSFILQPRPLTVSPMPAVSRSTGRLNRVRLCG